MASAEILRLWNDILAAPEKVETRAVFLVGPEGVGRTSELAEIRRQVAEGKHVRIVEGRWHVGGDYLEPFLDLIDARLLRGRLISRNQHRLLSYGSNALAVTPFVKDVYKVFFAHSVQDALSHGTPIDVALSDEAFCAAYCRRLHEAVCEEPLLALLDDIERLDVVGSRAWNFLGRTIETLVDQPALLVLAYQAPDDKSLDRFRLLASAHLDQRHWKMIKIAHLDSPQASAFARQLLDGHPAADSQRCLNALVQVAGGNRRLLRWAADAVRSAGNSEAQWLAAIDRLASHELVELPPHEHVLCDLVAGIDGQPDGRVFGTDSFHRYWNIAGREVRDLLARATARVSFPATREVVLAGLSEVRRRQDRMAYAAALSEAHQDTGDVGLLDEAARQYHLADALEEWAATSIVAARAYNEQDRAAEALDRYRAVRDSSVEMPAEARGRLLLEEAEAAFRVGDARHASEVLDAAQALTISLPPSTGTPLVAAANLLRGTLMAHGPNADRRGAIEKFDAVLATGIPAFEARARCEKAFCLTPFDSNAAQSEARAGIACARARGARMDELFGLHLLGDVLARAGGHEDEAERCLREVADSLEARPRMRAHALDSLGNFYARIGRYAEGVERFNTSIALKTELGDRDGLARSYGGLARLYHRHGDLTRAAEYYERDLGVIAEATPDDIGAFVQVNNLRAEVARMAGDYGEAHNRLEVNFGRLAALSDNARTVAEAYTRLLRSRLLLDQGRVDEAESDVDAAHTGLADMPTITADVDVSRARIAILRNRPAEALELLARARCAVAEPYARFDVEYHAAQAAAALGDHAAAAQARAQAREAAQVLQNQWMLLRLEKTVPPANMAEEPSTTQRTGHQP